MNIDLKVRGFDRSLVVARGAAKGIKRNQQKSKEIEKNQEGRDAMKGIDKSEAGQRERSQRDHQSVARVRCVVRGVVQGVGFRWFVLQRARRWKVTGWVRNNRDGSVSLEMQGSRDALQMMRDEIDQGPSWSRVDSVDVTEISVVAGERGFQVW
jgi:acylphosphatase